MTDTEYGALKGELEMWRGRAEVAEEELDGLQNGYARLEATHEKLKADLIQEIEALKHQVMRTGLDFYTQQHFDRLLLKLR